MTRRGARGSGPRVTRSRRAVLPWGVGPPGGLSEAAFSHPCSACPRRFVRSAVRSAVRCGTPGRIFPMPRFHTAFGVDNRGHEPAGGKAHRSRGRLVGAVVRRLHGGHRTGGRRRLAGRPVRLGGRRGAAPGSEGCDRSGGYRRCAGNPWDAGDRWCGVDNRCGVRCRGDDRSGEASRTGRACRVSPVSRIGRASRLPRATRTGRASRLPRASWTGRARRLPRAFRNS